MINKDSTEIQLSKMTYVSSTVINNSVVSMKSFGELIAEIDDNKMEVESLTAAEHPLLRNALNTRLTERNDAVAIQRENEKRKIDPLHSWKSFEELEIPQNLLRGIYLMGFITPSKIQEISLPILMANPPVNMIAQAQNGTGKTAAFLLASLSRINPQEKNPQVLILSPTYELALQTGEVAKNIARFCTDITFRYAVRGEKMQKNQTVREHVVIGTPGKVIDWVRRFEYLDIRKIRVFVLDEADVMISKQGHHDQCLRVHSMLPPDCQKLLFSATFTREVMNFAEQIVSNPAIIRVPREEEILDNVKQYYILCNSPDDKYKAVQNIYGAVSVGQTIVFCKTRSGAFWLGDKLTEDGHSVGYLSGDLTAEDRKAVITSFREGKEKVLITTNVCARGIDIKQVTMVINFDLPVLVNGQPDYETYLHRIGRTGRFGKSGIAVNLISDARDEKILEDIANHFGKPILHVNANNSDDLEKIY